MNALDESFQCARREQRALLIAYLMAGDPSVAATPDVVRAAIAGGADVIELGFPYSDPLADGPTIQAAATRAIARGASFDGNVAAGVAGYGVPVIAFGYWNPIFVRGVQKTVDDLAAAGFAGAIVADLPPEEGEEMRNVCEHAGLAMPLLVAPTTLQVRVGAIARAATGFVYVVSRLGVTGATATLDPGVGELVARVKRETDLPVAVGFGISTAPQAAEIARHADGVIVGSALVDLVARASSNDEACAAVQAACTELAAACRRKNWSGEL